MMKINFKKAILLFAIIPLLWSCGDEEPIIFSESNFVSFQTQTSNASENAGSSTLQIARSSSDLSGTLTVDVTVTSEFITTTSFFDAGDDAAGTFNVSTTSVTFAANEAVQTIDVSGIDDALSSGDKTVTVTITSVSDSGFNIGTPGPDALFSTHVITVIDDDCPIDLADFAGLWTYVDAIGTANSCCSGSSLNGFGFTNTGGDVTLTADTTDPTGTSAILTGGPFGSAYSIQFVTCPEEVVALGTTTSFVGNATWPMGQGATNGTYSSNRITVVGVLGGNGDFEMEFTKN